MNSNCRGKTLIYRALAGSPDPDVQAWDEQDPPLDFLQKAVGGFIEAVPGFLTIQDPETRKVAPCLAYCNEEGKLEKRPFNWVATRLWHFALQRVRDEHDVQVQPRGLMGPDGEPIDVLVGDVIIVTGDEKFLDRHMNGELD